MLDIFIKTLLIMCVFIAFAVPGFALKKLKMIGEGGVLTLSNVLLYVCQPALAISAFCVFSKEDWLQIQAVDKLTLLGNFGLTAAITLLAMGLVFGLCKLDFIKSKNKKAADVYSFAAVFSNCGFFGVPFVQMFTDGNPLAVMYMMVFSIFFNILCWTLGVFLISGDLKQISAKKILLNPTLIASAVAVIIFFVPEINIFMMEEVKEFAIFPQYLSYMTAPVSMIIVGIRLAETPLSKLFCNIGTYIAGGLRLIVAPFITLLVALPFMGLAGGGAAAFPEYVYFAPIIAMTMSPAAAVVAMSERFDGDKETATSVFVANTILSIATIPLIITAMTAILGIAV